PAVLNPTFEGSPDVGGADADLILGDCLVEIKTTLNPCWNRDWLYQLLGYVLLDYADHYQIRSIAIYLARQETIVRWPLKDVLTKTADGRALSLDQLRMSLKEVLRQSPQRTEGTLDVPVPFRESAWPNPRRRAEHGGSITPPAPLALQLELPGLQV